MIGGAVLALVSVALLAGAISCAVRASKAARRLNTLALGFLCAFLGIMGLYSLPELFLIPSDLGSLWFATHMRVGMTRDQISALRKSTFGSASGSGNIRFSSSSPAPDDDYTWYTNVAGFCYASGDVYGVRFDSQRRVRSWERGIWGDGC